MLTPKEFPPRQQLSTVKEGMQVPDPNRAKRYLRHIGYYRLSPYMIPFQK